MGGRRGFGHARRLGVQQQGYIAMGLETIVMVVVIVLIVLFVLGYFGRGRLRG